LFECLTGAHSRFRKDTEVATILRATWKKTCRKQAPSTPGSRRSSARRDEGDGQAARGPVRDRRRDGRGPPGSHFSEGAAEATAGSPGWRWRPIVAAAVFVVLTSVGKRWSPNESLPARTTTVNHIPVGSLRPA
jgi:hypothetical protein